MDPLAQALAKRRMGGTSGGIQPMALSDALAARDSGRFRQHNDLSNALYRNPASRGGIRYGGGIQPKPKRTILNTLTPLAQAYLKVQDLPGMLWSGAKAVGDSYIENINALRNNARGLMFPSSSKTFEKSMQAVARPSVDLALEVLGGGAFSAVPKGALRMGGGYRSRLQPAIEAMKQETMQAAQAQGHFNKFPGGVGKDELEYSGVQGMIDAGQPVTKTGLLEQYNANPLQINDVYRGNVEGGTGQNIDYLMGRERMMRAGEGDYGNLPPSLRAERADEMLAEIQAIEQSQLSGTPKFSDYTLPGGEDYRELLMTLPDKRLPASAWQQYRDELLNDGFDPRLTDDVRRWASGSRDVDIEAVRKVKGDAWLNEYAGVIKNMKDQPLPYKSGHYDEPNILAHARYNTRNIDGDKTLFIEEIQSDWHQAGRKKGYKTKDNLIDGKDYDYWRKETDRRFTGRTTEERAGWREAKDNRDKLGEASNAVPDAPYKATDKWQGLAFQRTVKEAVDQGHDRIAWTPGDVQADRYDLSNQVTEIRYNKLGDDKFEAMVFPMGQEKAITRTGTPDELSDFVGKEIAEKMVKGEGEVFNSQGVMTLGGGDLKVGGEGMKSFYDKMMVKTANKFGKKYGAKVDVSKIDATDLEIFSIEGSPGYSIIHNDKKLNFKTIEKAEAYINKQGGKEVWSMKITPEMKKAMAGGVALSGLGIINMPGMGGEE